MIVKILSSGSSFSGIKYNENKVSTGSADLLAAENFGLLELDNAAIQRGEYLQFLKEWSTKPDGGMIANPQFHVAISCEGREYEADELKDIAQQYLDKMGYADNPYLIYFHSDTANNHVHIVSSRVGADGLKIDDSFERTRSQAAIKEILKEDVGYEMNSHVETALKYSFSTEAQFRMLLEMEGVEIRENESKYKLYKYYGLIQELSKDAIAKRVEQYEAPEQRIKQIKALFQKYKPGLEPDKFADFMKEKFGVELIFHKAEGKDTPYGYTVIDHAKNHVLKGSQIMKLSNLLAVAPRAETLKAGGELIKTLAGQEQLTYRDFKSQLSKVGLDVNPSGKVKIKGEEKASFTISKERIKQLMYNDRFSEAQKYTVSNQAEAEVLSKIFSLKKEDVEKLGQSQPEGKPQKLRPEVKAGELLDFGAAPYHNNANNGDSYFAKIKTAKGELTLWGKDLERAIEEGGAKIGDKVGIEHLGKQQVTVTTKVKDSEGNLVEKDIQAERNTWELKPLDDSHYQRKLTQQEQQQITSDKLNSKLAAGKDLEEIAKQDNYTYAKKGGEVYLIDRENHNIYNMKELTDRKLDYTRANVIDLDRAARPEFKQDMELTHGSLADVAVSLLYLLQANSYGTEGERKKRAREERTRND